MAPTKQIKLKIKANLKKSIFFTQLIKKCKVKIPIKKLKIKAGHDSEIRVGCCKKRYKLEAKTTGIDIRYEIFNISSGFVLFKESPKIVDPERDNPGITAKPCKNPTISAKLDDFMLNLDFFL